MPDERHRLSRSAEDYLEAIGKLCHRYGEAQVSEIALMLGFNSIHYFSRAFTQKYHMAPSEYSKTLYKT